MTSNEERCAVMDTERFDCTDTCEYPDGNWIVGSSIDTNEGGLRHGNCSGETCPETCVSNKWQYVKDNKWQDDSSLRISCG